MTFDTELETLHWLELHVVRTCVSFRSKDCSIQLYEPPDLFTRKFSQHKKC